VPSTPTSDGIAGLGGVPAGLPDVTLLAQLAGEFFAACLRGEPSPAQVAAALTPHEALANMFAKLRTRFDPKLLQIFVRCLGVYPPGTIVQLSNGLIGMVATINTAKPMKPMVVVYDQEIPKEEALLVDLETEAEVDAAFEAALAAGATALKRPEKVFWGGYSGYFTDPDGFLWEVAHNPAFPHV